MKIYDDVLDKQFLDYINQSISKMKWEIHRSTHNQETPVFFNSVTIDQNIQKNEFIFLFDNIFSIIKNESWNACWNTVQKDITYMLEMHAGNKC